MKCEGSRYLHMFYVTSNFVHNLYVQLCMEIQWSELMLIESVLPKSSINNVAVFSLRSISSKNKYKYVLIKIIQAEEKYRIMRDLQAIFKRLLFIWRGSSVCLLNIMHNFHKKRLKNP